MTDDRPLLERFPTLAKRVRFARLGDFPTRVERMQTLEASEGLRAPLFVKRDDRSSPVYGGNKVRTLEVLFAEAKAAGAKRIYSTGAFGSNHALAATLHAPRVGLEPGAILFPQPRSYAAVENLRVLLAKRTIVRAYPHWSFLPFGMQMTKRREGKDAFIMVPGGATPRGALGYISAALELADQMDEVDTVLVGVGSTCTSAGLLVGMHAAVLLGKWKRVPRLVSARVTPWPVTAKFRIVSLAREAALLLAKLTGDDRLAFSKTTLASRFEVDGAFLGRGYGYASEPGLEAIRTFREGGAFEVDTTYGAKSAASAIARVRRGLEGPLVYWATKSTVPLPDVQEEDWRWAPPRVTRWIERAEREHRRP
jgi:D-cysteine desulfhydrase